MVIEFSHLFRDCAIHTYVITAASNSTFYSFFICIFEEQLDS